MALAQYACSPKVRRQACSPRVDQLSARKGLTGRSVRKQESQGPLDEQQMRAAARHSALGDAAGPALFSWSCPVVVPRQEGVWAEVEDWG